MTNQQYCKKTVNSKKILVWHFLDGSTLKETEMLSAKNITEFRRFQDAEVLKIENTRTENHVYLNINKGDLL